MLKITSFKENDLEEAAELVGRRHRRLREHAPDLPRRYSEAAHLLPLLQDILSGSGGGVAAWRGERLAGFLTGWQMQSFRGKRSTYSPEWANAADLDDSARIYEEMYSRLAEAWVADGFIGHYISLFPNDAHALRAWNWLGFGMVSVDAIRSLEAIPGSDLKAQIRRAGLQDLEQVMELQEDLRLYMKGTPIFLLAEEKERSYYEEWLQNPDKVVWLAYCDGEPAAFMRLGPADEDVCTIIIDEKTTSIYGAFTKEGARREGIATALLNRALEAARQAGYERCAVPFEPMNLLGSRFWLKYFQPVCYTVMRQIDDRLTKR